MILLLVSGGHTRAFAAVPSASGFDPPLPSFSFDRDVELYAVRWDVSLALLGLPQGELELRMSPQPPPVAASGVHVSRLAGGTQEPWGQGSLEVVAPLLGYVPWGPACPIGQSPRFMQGPSAIVEGAAKALVALGPGRALLSTTSTVYLVTAEQGQLGVRELPRTASFLDAALAPDGRVWLVDATGGLRTLEADRVEEEEWREVRGADGAALTWELGGESPAAVLAGSRDGGPFELFARIEPARLQHFDGARWRFLPEPSAALSLTPGLAWLGRGRVAALGSAEEGETVFEVDVGAVPEPPVNPVGRKLTGLGFIESVGLVAGGQGFAAVEREGAWELIQVRSSNGIAEFDMTHLLPLPVAGFVAIFKTGGATWAPELGVCQAFFILRTVRVAVALNGGFLLAGEGGLDPDDHFVVTHFVPCTEDAACPRDVE